MGENTAISWAHHTFNPWWGCVKVSPGCTNCYAATFDHRLGGKHWGPKSRRRFFGEKHWEQPAKWQRKAIKTGERQRVFCASMADVFEDLPMDHPDRAEVAAARIELWAVIRDTMQLDWLLLTKRPENFRRFLPDDFLPNVWLGVTAEDQEHADLRIPLLLETPASKRFVSYEPALGPIDIRRYLWPVHSRWPAGYDSHGEAIAAGKVVTRHPQCLLAKGVPLVKWVIAGAESGPGARPMNEEWVRDVRTQCSESETAFFYKQRIDDGRKVELPELDGAVWSEVPA